MTYRKFTAKTAAAAIAAASTISLTAPVAAQETYTIQRGDELGTIARRIEGVQVGGRDLCSLNSDVTANCGLLKIGTVIVPPEGASIPTLELVDNGTQAEDQSAVISQTVIDTDDGENGALQDLEEQTGFRTTWSIGERFLNTPDYFILATANEDNQNGSAFYSQGVVLSPGTYSLSLIVKAPNEDVGTLLLRPTVSDAFGDAVQVWFDLTNGSILSESKASGASIIASRTASIEPLSDGAFIASISFDVTEEANTSLRGYITDAPQSLFVTAGRSVQYIHSSISVVAN